ncbi:MAG: alanine racemase [Solirubrobacteraceae bacterium]|nr:alanine racemase [Solirubrobacteraceae bacterium]
MTISDAEKTTLRRAVAHVDLAAIAANVEFLRSRLTGGAELCAVVKADGYGHGCAEVAKASVRGGATRLAVVTVEEAALVANLDLGVPVILLAPVNDDEIVAAVATGAELTVWSPDQVESVARAAAMLDRDVNLHIKLDSGMGRFGARDGDEALAAIGAANQAERVEPVAVWTHFATADELGDDYFPRQLERFTEFVAAARVLRPELLAHAANSAALLRDPASHFDFARAGIAIYGLDPFGGDAIEAGLAPALSLHSYVASVRSVAPGESVGYGRRFVADEVTRIATVPIGYGDGWPRILTNNCDVLIAGQRYRQRGTVSMDSIMVELGADSVIAVGTPVTLIGRDGVEAISTEEVAERAQTINYEITCGLTARTARDYGRGD